MLPEPHHENPKDQHAHENIQQDPDIQEHGDLAADGDRKQQHRIFDHQESDQVGEDLSVRDNEEETRVYGKEGNNKKHQVIWGGVHREGDHNAHQQAQRHKKQRIKGGQGFFMNACNTGPADDGKQQIGHHTHFEDQGLSGNEEYRCEGDPVELQKGNPEQQDSLESHQTRIDPEPFRNAEVDQRYGKYDDQHVGHISG